MTASAQKTGVPRRTCSENAGSTTVTPTVVQRRSLCGFPLRYLEELDRREAQIESAERNLAMKNERFVRLEGLLEDVLSRSVYGGGSGAVEAQHQIQLPPSGPQETAVGTPGSPGQPSDARGHDAAEMDVETVRGGFVRRGTRRSRRLRGLPVEAPRLEKKRSAHVLDDGAGTEQDEATVGRTPKKVRRCSSYRCELMICIVLQKRSDIAEEKKRLEATVAEEDGT